jgi:hypothetical protein
VSIIATLWLQLVVTNKSCCFNKPGHFYEKDYNQILTYALVIVVCSCFVKIGFCTLSVCRGLSLKETFENAECMEGCLKSILNFRNW